MRRSLGDRSWGQVGGPSGSLKEPQGTRAEGRPARVNPGKQGGEHAFSNSPPQVKSSMVRRRFPVRVRERALKPPHSGGSGCPQRARRAPPAKGGSRIGRGAK